jgi:hypothetical protein
MNAALLMAAMMLPAPQDTHTPSYTIEGDVVVIDAEIAWIPTNPAVTNNSPEGWTLLDPSQQGPSDSIAFISGLRNERIRWRLTPGDWEITALGHADNLSNPNRQQQTFTFTISGPTRQEQIVLLVMEYLTAKRDLQLLQPPATREEILTAVIEAIARGL